MATKQTKQKKLGIELGMFYSMRSGSKYQQYKSLPVYPSLVNPKALEDLFISDDTKVSCVFSNRPDFCSVTFGKVVVINVQIINA